MSVVEFEAFPKLARLSRDCVITEKIDGTNAQLIISDDGQVVAGSRNRLITPEDDNFGFARWAAERASWLAEFLGPGRHFGEWWGAGIQRRYGLTGNDKRFSLFNTARWNPETLPSSYLSVVPVLYRGPFHTDQVDAALARLARDGSQASPGFMQPEGVVVWHEAARVMFKKTLGDDGHKGAGK